MARITDIALIGGIAAVAFIIWRSGRDLFGALPALGEGLSDVQENISNQISSLQEGFGQQVSNIQEGFSDSIESSQESFSNFLDSLQGLSREDVDINFSAEQQKIADSVGKEISDLGCQCGETIKQDAQGNIDISCKTCENQQQEQSEIPEGTPPASDIVNDILDKALEPQKEFPTEQPAQTEIEGQMSRFQQAEGGSFAGGAILETPVENLSLGQIIDKFGVTASQAADIKAQAADDFPEDFDFGTNTGNAEFAATREIPEFGSFQGGGITGDESFQGMSPEEISKILTGGNISNF